MSSYLVNSETINKIVAGLGVANQAAELPDVLKFDDPADFGVTLYQMNLNAVEQRYPDCIGNPDNLPGEVDADGHHKPYKYSYIEVTTVSDLSDTIREYLYQCSEGDVHTLPLFAALDAFYEAIKMVQEKEKAAAQVEHQKEVAKTEYINATDTAKLLRTQLAKNFPGVKFSVKTEKYAGGASIDITWTDGPAEKEVKKVSDAFSGSGFDGMADYKTSNAAWLSPDGSVIFAECESYGGDNYTATKPHPEAKRVSFGADYIFEHRHFTPEFAKPIIKAVCDEFGKPEPKYYENKNGKEILLDWDSLSPNWGDLDHFINQQIWDRLNGKLPEPTQPEPVKKARASSATYGMKF
jgi:hypothetical protein